ncbi:MAG: hypothetical protein V1660_03665 [archaeon]
MDKRGKSLLAVAGILAIILVIGLYFVFAANVELALVSPGGTINGSAQITFNVTINNTEFNATGGPSVNITHVNITIDGTFILNILTNGSDVLEPGLATGPTFSNTTNGTLSVLEWKNATDGLIQNATVPLPFFQTRYFWINITPTAEGMYPFVIDTLDSNGMPSPTAAIYTISVNDPNEKPAVNIVAGPPYGLIYNTTNASFNLDINFSCNATDGFGLNQIALFLTQQDGPWIVTQTNVTGTYNQTNFTKRMSFPGNFSWYCQALGNQGHDNATLSRALRINMFYISGRVIKSDLTNASGANVSIYEETMQMNGPPISTLINQTIADSTGYFTLIVPNSSRGSMEPGPPGANYKLKFRLENAQGLVIEVGPSLPQMPREPFVFSMNGGNIYLQKAVTLQLYANNVNATGQGARQLFGYEVIDNSLGYPMESNVQSNVSTVNVTVPIGRSYTVMFARSPEFFNESEECWDQENGNMGWLMNDTHCPTPPININLNWSCINASANGVYGAGCNTTEANFSQYLVKINKSLIYTPLFLEGCINIAGNITDVNLTDIKTKMIPWTGFIPSMTGEITDFNPDESKYYTKGRGEPGGNYSGCTVGNYSLQVVGASTGMQFMMEAYAESSTGAAGNREYYAAFKNLTFTTLDQEYNFTLVKLLGTYAPADDISTKRISVNITDENGTAPRDMFVEVTVKNNASESFHYMIGTIENGIFNITLLNNTQKAEVKVYSSQYAPKEQKINLGAAMTNVTLYSFKPQRIEKGGINNSKMSGNELIMRFMSNSAACNVYTPAASCKIGDDKSANFDPMQAMMAGKANLWMKTSSNVTLYFINVDMMASGPPDAMISDDVSRARGGASSSTGLEQAWKFGSSAPDVYDYVMIGIPYNTSINETTTGGSGNWTYSIKMSNLYDNEWNVVWNATLNGSVQLPSDYSDFNSSWFTSGMNCSTSSTLGTQQCYMNMSDIGGHAGYFWITIPHFSSTESTITGGVTSLPSQDAGSTPGSTSGSGGINTVIYDMGDYAFAKTTTRDMDVGDYVKFTLAGKTNHTIKLSGVTSTRISVQIKTINMIVTKTVDVNKSIQVDVNNDGIADIEIIAKSTHTSASLSSAVLEIRSLSLASGSDITTPQNATETTTPAAQTGNENATGQTGGQEIVAQKTATKMSALQIILIVIVIIIAIVAITLISKATKKKVIPQVIIKKK